MTRYFLVVAPDELRTHLTRTLLGALSVIIGVTAVVLAISLRDSTSGSLIEALEKHSGREATYRVRLVASDPVPTVSRVDDMANWRELLSLVRTVLGEVALLTLLVGAPRLLNLGLPR